MFDNLYIDDNYTDSTSFGTDYLDIDNMRVDTAMESFSLIDPEYDTDDAFYYACESLLDAIETDLEVIALEADSADGKVGAKQTVKNGLAKIVEAIRSFCEKNEMRAKERGEASSGVRWEKWKTRCDLYMKSLRGQLSESELQAMKDKINKLKEAVKKFQYSEKVAKKDAKAKKKADKQDLKNYKKDFRNRKKQGKENNDMGIEEIGTQGESFIVTDDDFGYEIVVEGLFSKPKTAEEMLTKMQKKVGKLKTIGACDDMLRQLDNESKNFNNAISALKQATASYQESNDKKTYRKTAGPVLKGLNKTCKLLKIKSIASDPKNITQDEIKKLHDFIVGAKQLIQARKKALAGGGANESYLDDDDMLMMLQSDDFDFDDIADEALIEDFDDADQTIAIATEGIIDPDAKRAHRIKFGEKKRQIKSVVKKARQAKKAKDFKTSIELYREAKSGYKGLLAEAKKLPDRAANMYSAGGLPTGTGKKSSGAKVKLINWCIKKMGECDNAIEAIQNKQMKIERKAATAAESYMEDVYAYESIIENLEDDDYEDFDFDDIDDEDDDYATSGLESLMS